MDEKINFEEFTVESNNPLSKMLCTLLTLNEPRKVAIAQWLVAWVPAPCRTSP